MNTMNREQLLTEIQTPTGRIIRIGERHTNAFGVELEVKEISRLPNEQDVLVEFMPVDVTLTHKWWWGMFLPECRLNVSKQPV